MRSVDKFVFVPRESGDYFVIRLPSSAMDRPLNVHEEIILELHERVVALEARLKIAEVIVTLVRKKYHLSDERKRE